MNSRKTGKKRKTSKVLIVSLIISVIALAGIVSVLTLKSMGYLPVNKADTVTSQTEEQAQPETPPEPSDTVFFASDYQIESGWDTPAETLTGILKAVNSDGKKLTNTVFCGDYTNDSKLHDYQVSPDDSINEIKGIVADECPGVPQEDIIFVQGNHDRMTDLLSASGLHEYDDYLVYVLNTENDFPWKQGRNPEFKGRVIRASEEMKKCLDELAEKGETRPVFIAGHVPIHFTARTSSRHNTGDNMYASYIFNTVNEAADSLDIVYLFGHNHSKGWDCYLGGSSVYKAPGDTILIPDAGDNTVSTDTFTEETLKFTYLNAGYVGYYMNCGPDEKNSGKLEQYSAADETLTGVVCEIMPEELILTRYSADGIHQLGAEGEGNPYRGGVDEGLIAEANYSRRTDSPQHIQRKHAGQTGSKTGN